MMGLLFPVLLGGLGLGFEISNWYLRTRAMQNAADAAVMAAASNSESNYNVEAAAVAAHYGFVNGTDNVTVAASNNATCPAGANINPPCYSVTISSIVPLFLSQFVGYSGDTTLNGAPEKTIVTAEPLAVLSVWPLRSSCPFSITRTAPVKLSGVVITTSPVSCTSPHICTSPLKDLLPDHLWLEGRGGSFFLEGSCGYAVVPKPHVTGILIANAE